MNEKKRQLAKYQKELITVWNKVNSENPAYRMVATRNTLRLHYLQAIIPQLQASIKEENTWLAFMACN